MPCVPPARALALHGQTAHKSVSAGDSVTIAARTDGQGAAQA